MYRYLRKNGTACTGCGACVNACPADAIGYGEDLETDGSIVAQIDPVKCVGCDRCKEVCPQLTVPANTNDPYPACYAVAADDDVREKSSSGGAFTVFAEHILARGGVVCGAAWNDAFEAEHIMVSDAAGLDKLRRSKYFQSRAGYIYREVKAELEAGKEVLFVGCPCQVAGLRAYLGKDYEGLFLIDIYCNYAPSPVVFRRYLHEDLDVSRIADIDFRVKEHGWISDIHRVTYKDGEAEERRPDSDAFQMGYHPRLFMRKVCEDCKYAGFPRQGDLTIGDFWYIEHFHPDLNDRKGTSCVLLNNAKARDLFAGVRAKWKLSRAVGLDCMQYNRAPGAMAHPARDRFYSLLRTEPFDEAVGKALSGRYDAVVWGCWSEKNYGS